MEAKSYRSWRIEFAVFGIAFLIAIFSALPYAGAWNDGSRLAGVESLAERRTLAIDDSIFVNVPTTSPSPYPEHDVLLQSKGTLDKLFIDGHYYSDKSPVPALLMAGAWKVLNIDATETISSNPARFCWWMTVLSSSLAYAVAVASIFLLGSSLGLPTRTNILCTASFALSTIALAYSRHVNNHILLLGLGSAFLLQSVRIAESLQKRIVPWSRLVVAGTLVGFGYTVDLGAGPIFLGCASLWVLYRCRAVRPCAVFALATLPWLVAHHVVNYYVGGTIKPANAVPEYLAWPGSPFNTGNMTGSWNHKSVGHFVMYSVAMMFGKRGLLVHDLPLLLMLPALALLLKPKVRYRPELIFGLAWFAGTWGIYALTSNNHSGECCSVRWFVPLLAPGWFLVMGHLRECPEKVPDFLILSAGGLALSTVMWWHGPWARLSEAVLWPTVGVTLSCWGRLVWKRNRWTLPWPKPVGVVGLRPSARP